MLVKNDKFWGQLRQGVVRMADGVPRPVTRPPERSGLIT